MAASKHHYLVEGIIVASFAYSLMLLQGNSISGTNGSGDGSMFGVALPQGAIVFGAATR
jgi:hypothetical protein